jgi:hypothetical protein
MMSADRSFAVAHCPWDLNVDVSNYCAISSTVDAGNFATCVLKCETRTRVTLSKVVSANDKIYQGVARDCREGRRL